MRVAAVQYKAHKGRPEESRARLVALADRAGSHANLVVLPEMAVTGYVFASAAEVGEVAESPEGPTFCALSEVAARRGCWLVCGYPERGADALYNSALVIDPGGELAFSYRKTLLYVEDRRWARPGDSGYRVFETGAGRFGVGICMDLNDEGFTAWCRSADLRALAFPTNWVEEGEDVWGYWAARLAGSGTALVAANTYGSEGAVAFSGRSAIIDGRVVRAAAPRVGDCVITARLP